MHKIDRIGDAAPSCQTRYLGSQPGQAQGQNQSQQIPVFIAADLIAFIQPFLEQEKTADDKGHAGDIGQPLYRVQLGIGPRLPQDIQRDKENVGDLKKSCARFTSMG